MNTADTSFQPRRRRTSLISKRAEDDTVDEAWRMHYVELIGNPNWVEPTCPTNSLASPHTGAPPVAPVTLLDVFLEQQDRLYAASREEKLQAANRRTVHEWLKTRKNPVVPRRGCFKDARWRWMLLKSYVVQQDCITNYIPKSITSSKQECESTQQGKRRIVLPPCPAATPPLGSASPEKWFDDLVCFREEFAAYLALENQYVNYSNNGEDEDEVDKAADANTRGKQLPTSALGDLAAIGRLLMTGGTLAIEKLSPEAHEMVRRVVATIAEDSSSGSVRESFVKKQFTMLAQQLAACDRVEVDAREMLDGEAKRQRSKRYGARVRDGIYLQLSPGNALDDRVNGSVALPPSAFSAPAPSTRDASQRSPSPKKQERLVETCDFSFKSINSLHQLLLLEPSTHASPSPTRRPVSAHSNVLSARSRASAAVTPTPACLRFDTPEVQEKERSDMQLRTIVAHGESYLFAQGKPNIHLNPTYREWLTASMNDDALALSSTVDSVTTHEISKLCQSNATYAAAFGADVKPLRCTHLILRDNELCCSPSSTAGGAHKSGFEHLNLFFARRFPQYTSSIVYLDLSNNHLEAVPPQLASLTALSTLFLHGNRIASLVSLYELVGVPPSFLLTPMEIASTPKSPTPKNNRFRLSVTDAMRTARSTPAKLRSRVHAERNARRRVDVGRELAQGNFLRMRLTSFTMHGNPVELADRATYKANVLWALPLLLQLDYTAVIPTDLEDVFSQEQTEAISALVSPLKGNSTKLSNGTQKAL